MKIRKYLRFETTNCANIITSIMFNLILFHLPTIVLDFQFGQLNEIIYSPEVIFIEIIEIIVITLQCNIFLGKKFKSRSSLTIYLTVFIIYTILPYFFNFFYLASSNYNY